MGMYSDWTLRMKRKDGQPVTEDAKRVSIAIEELESEIDNDFDSYVGKGLEYGSSFYTESIGSWSRIEECLTEVSKQFPELVFFLEWKGEDYFSATIFDNGEKEDLVGRITYDEPQRLKY